MTNKNEIVWLIEDRCFARLVSMGAHVSTVYYTRAGIDYEIIVDNDEYIFYEREGSDLA